MKKVFYALAVVMLLVSCDKKPQKVVLSPQDFEKQIENNSVDIEIIDARTPLELKAGYIKGAKNIDYKDSENFSKAIRTLDKSKTYYVYCRSGGKSKAVTDSLVNLGFTNVYELEGGIKAWDKANLPLENVPTDEYTADQFKALLHAADYTLVDLYAPWCKYCIKLEPVVDSLSTAYEGKVKLMKINVDANKKLTQPLVEQGLPTIILYKDTVLVWNGVGFMEYDVLKSKIDSVMNIK